MDGNIGIIFIDNTEVLIRFYAKLSDKWTVLHNQTRDLTSFNPSQPLDPKEVISVVAEASLTGYKFHVTDWRMYARAVPDSLLLTIRQSTGFVFESLTLSQEQLLFIQGILWRIEQEVQSSLPH